MNKVELNKKILELAQKWFYMPLSENASTPIEKIVDLCESYLKENPYDTDIWIKLALAVYTCPYSDDIKAMECMNAILSYDPTNPYALIILGYMESHWSRITDATFGKLSLVKDENNEIMSMVEFVKAWYYLEHNNDELYQKTLEHSVTLYPHVRNCINLAGLYFEQGRIEESTKLKDLGLANIQLLVDYSGNKPVPFYDITDLNHFLDTRIKEIRAITG